MMLPSMSTTTPRTNKIHESITTTEVQSQTALKRVYGENLAAQIYTDINSNDYKALVKKFTENNSRWIMDYSMANQGTNLAARKYIIEQMENLSNGRIQIELIGRHYNIVGKLPGYLPGNHSVFVVSAHYDSQRLSPGANCDGSGIAALISLVRMMSKYEWPLDIYFIAFNGLFTYGGMTGSPEVANAFQQRDIKILALYNIDTILVPGTNVPRNEQVQMGYMAGGLQNYQKGQYWAELTRMMGNNYGTNVIVPVPSNSFALWDTSDQYSFFERTYTNVLCAFESGKANDQAYQSGDDKWDNLDYRYSLGREVTAVIGATMAFTMSRAYGESTTIRNQFSLGSGIEKRFYFAVTTPTIVNVSIRWFGGPSRFAILDPNDNPIVTRAYSNTSAWQATQVFSQALTTKGLYSITVLDTGYTGVGYDLNFTYDTDIDGNGILDKNEYWLPHSYFVTDHDGDGLMDAYEIFYGTNMYNADSDGDGMPDKYEIDMGFNPLNASDALADADNDGLTNLKEYELGTNPLNPDTDGDGMPDAWEVANGLNPLVNDANLDPDGDGLTNLQEYLLGTNPQEAQPKPLSPVWMLSPIVVIAPIVMVLYLRREKMY